MMLFIIKQTTAITPITHTITTRRAVTITTRTTRRVVTSKTIRSRDNKAIIVITLLTVKRLMNNNTSIMNTITRKKMNPRSITVTSIMSTITTIRKATPTMTTATMPARSILLSILPGLIKFCHASRLCPLPGP